MSKKTNLLVASVGAWTLSVVFTTVVFGLAVGAMYLKCFVTQGDFAFPFKLVEIISQEEGGGFYTTLSFSHEIVYVILIISVIITAMATIRMILKDRKEDGEI